MLQCLSHSPLIGAHNPHPDVEAKARAAIAAAREGVERFRPDLVVLFAPDHFNGFFHDVMPPFCIGAKAESVGDYGMPTGALDVPTELAIACAQALQTDDVDVALSHRMQLDHGFTQPLLLLGGGDELGRFPVLPVFVNAVGVPRPPMRRVRRLGEALGRFLAQHHAAEKRILLVGSGGISHDPPVPSLAGAPPEVAERLIAGRFPSPAALAARAKAVVGAARAFADGSPYGGGNGALLPLNPDWDQEVLRLLAHARFSALDQLSDEEITAKGGRGGHEIRAWVAAFACLSAFGPYRAEVTYYRAIPEWISGFAVMHAVPEQAPLEQGRAA